MVANGGGHHFGNDNSRMEHHEYTLEELWLYTLFIGFGHWRLLSVYYVLYIIFSSQHTTVSLQVADLACHAGTVCSLLLVI